MGTFAFYFIIKLLNSVGWPRRRSIFNSEAIINVIVLDDAIQVMIDLFAALGACRPKKALQMIATMHKDKDWEGENAPRILDFINGSRWEDSQYNKKSPHEIINFPNLLPQRENIRLKDLKGVNISLKYLKSMNTDLETFGQAALLWGLAYSDRFNSWYERYYKESTEELPWAQKAGLKIDSIPTLSKLLEESEETLNSYERERGLLSKIPPKLLADACALGREI
ncbi:MAG: hypothetical protein WC309_02380 [Candidatus Paceibacterota bacterium]|jgi:hypothetical protein